MRRVHVSGYAHLPLRAGSLPLDEAEQVEAVTRIALEEAGLTRSQVGFVCSASSDWVMGRAFSFVQALDGVGAWPPIRESHVEMDGAWALYEAWVRLQHGDIEAAVVYAFGRASFGGVDEAIRLQLDPYTLQPLGIGPFELAALQAAAMVDAGAVTDADLAAVVQSAWTAAQRRPDLLQGGGHAGTPPAAWRAESGAIAVDAVGRALPRPVQPPSAVDVAPLLQAPRRFGPLRAHDQALRADGAAAIVLRIDGPGPRIAGIAHCVDPHQPGLRNPNDCAAARAAAARAGGVAGVHVAELHATFSHEVPLLRRSLGLDDQVVINPSGGAMVGDTPMVTGLMRILEAARAVEAGAGAALAHAAMGPWLQHNLIVRLEAR
jgi:hypothetical protein